MGATQQRHALASYRDAATELRKAGELLGDIGDAIDDVAVLTMGEEAKQQRDARAHLATLE